MNRHRAKRIAIFNHKGGVGKTTLTLNIAEALVSEGNKVLLVDSDPQCNLTSYLFPDDVVDNLLDSSDTPDGNTLWSAVKPVVNAEGDIANIKPYETEYENLFIIPGDIRLSEFEAELGEFWRQCSLRKTKGFRGVTALSRLVNKIADKHDIDYVFYDSGPNIGPLNKIVLLDCDYFIVPVACDLFSLRALKTLGASLVNWIVEWDQIAGLAPQELYLLPGRPEFLGYIPEGFRTYGGAPAKDHSNFLDRIEKEVYSQIIALLRKIDKNLARGRINEFRLGEVKDFGTLVAASQKIGVSMRKAAHAQSKSAETVFTQLAKKIMSRISKLNS